MSKKPNQLSAVEQTVELGRLRLKLKQGLNFTQRKSGNQIWYLVEDEVCGRFYQIGIAEYTLLSLMNGQRNINGVMKRGATILGPDSLDDRKTAELCKWAIDANLLESAHANNIEEQARQNDQLKLRKSVSALNPITFRIPLFGPDRLAAWSERIFRPFLGFGGLMLWLLVVVYGMMQLFSNRAEIISNRFAAIGPNDLIWFLVTWIGLKLIHESCHAIACKRFGGRIHQCGLLFLLLIPMPFVDVTSSWSFDNKWKRILTSAAGMMGEFFIASLACICWAQVDSPMLQFHLSNVIVAASIHTMLFNANPLMRFDGYYILSDLVEIPNLYTHGRSFVRSVAKRLFFGVSNPPLKEVGFRRRVVQIYGVLSICWFVVVSTGLVFAASRWLPGIGLLFAGVAIAFWMLMPLWKLMVYFFSGTATDRPRRFRFLFSLSVLGFGLFSFFRFCPGPTVVTAPVVVDYQPMGLVRAKAEGFASKLHVRDGDLVEEGQLLVTLENEDLENELDALRLDIKISELRTQALLNEGEIGKLKLEQEAQKAMLERQSELKSLISQLQVRAPKSGTVIAPGLKSRLSTLLEPGEEILSIANPNDLQVTGLASQSDSDWIEDLESVTIQLDGQNRSMQGKVKSILPRARVELPHPAFAAANGGRLAVTQHQEPDNQSINGQFILLEPRLSVRIEIPETDRQSCMAGQTGLMIVRSREQSMGQYIFANLNRFLRQGAFDSHGL